MTDVSLPELLHKINNMRNDVVALTSRTISAEVQTLSRVLTAHIDTVASKVHYLERDGIEVLREDVKELRSCFMGLAGVVESQAEDRKATIDRLAADLKSLTEKIHSTNGKGVLEEGRKRGEQIDELTRTLDSVQESVRALAPLQSEVSKLKQVGTFVGRWAAIAVLTSAGGLGGMKLAGTVMPVSQPSAASQPAALPDSIVTQIELLIDSKLQPKADVQDAQVRVPQQRTRPKPMQARQPGKPLGRSQPPMIAIPGFFPGEHHMMTDED